MASAFTCITAQHGYEAYLADERSDEPIISARTLWIYVDARGRPMRLPEGTAQIWQPEGPNLQQLEVPLPACPQSSPATTSCVVFFSDIDPMRHLNNAATVEMLDNAGWEVILPDSMGQAHLRFSSFS